MHSKIILYSLSSALPSTRLSFLSPHSHSSIKRDGFLYVGSHNHTRAAWGSFQVKKPIVGISNWELGVVVPFWFARQKELGHFTVPFQIPPPAYAANDDPWIMSEHI